MGHAAIIVFSIGTVCRAIVIYTTNAVKTGLGSFYTIYVNLISVLTASLGRLFHLQRFQSAYSCD